MIWGTKTLLLKMDFFFFISEMKIFFFYFLLEKKKEFKHAMLGKKVRLRDKI